MRIKVIDHSGSYVTFKYLLANSKSRMPKSDFQKNVNNGVFTVTNPIDIKE